MLEKMAQVRSGLVRVSSYLGLVNFLILMGIALRWAHGVVAPGAWFLGWMIAGFLLAVVGLSVAAWVDRHWIWPREVGINQGVNPLTLVWAIHAAELVLRLEGHGAGEIAHNVERAMKNSGYLEHYRSALEVLKRTQNGGRSR